MAKIPKDPSEVFGEFTDDCKEIFGSQLQAIFLFGSGARGEYVPGRSDINFLVVVHPDGLQMLRRIIPFVPRWKKRAISVPLILTREYMERSLDSYPMELLDLKLHHVVVFGDDFLKELMIRSADLRLQCEREIKGKLLHLRQNFVSSGLQPKWMRSILVATIPAFRTIFEALLYLKEQSVPAREREVFEKTAELFELNRQTVGKILGLRDSKTKLSKEELIELFEAYIREIQKLSQAVDRM